MTDCGTSERAAAIEAFAATLRELRTAAGTPSFREMSGRSRAISHTTLHEAAQGHRLPSWPTTVEFVKACGGDPALFRQQWLDARRTVQADGVAAADDPVPAVDQPGSVADPEPVGWDEPPESHEPRGSRERRVRWSRPVQVLAGAAVVGLAAAVTVALVAGSRDDGSRSAPAPSHALNLAASGCPVPRRDPPAAPPANPGDEAQLVADLTLPDCSTVGTDRTVRKMWRLKNIGTRSWHHYELRRIDVPQRGDQCQTITDVRVPPTRPGRFVEVGVDVTTPATPTFCYVRFKMIDDRGRIAFPGSRPLNFQIVVR